MTRLDPALLRVLPWDIRAEIAENLVRKNFTETELADIQARLRTQLQQRFPRGRRADSENPQTLGGLFGVEEADEAVGRIFGESRETVRKRREVAVAARTEPEKYGDLARLMDATGVHRAFRSLAASRAREQNEALVRQTPPLDAAVAGRRFPAIVVDPPWDSYGSAEGVAGRARPRYATMTIEQIGALPVPDLAEPNAHLYLWGINILMPPAFDLLEQCGASAT